MWHMMIVLDVNGTGPLVFEIYYRYTLHMLHTYLHIDSTMQQRLPV